MLLPTPTAMVATGATLAGLGLGLAAGTALATVLYIGQQGGGHR